MHSMYFTANGTWTCPENTNAILISGAGGAGGGGGGSGLGFAAAGNTFFSGAGGGGGCFEQKTVLTVVPGTVYTIIIGEGGAGGVGGIATEDDLLSDDGEVIVYTEKQLGTNGYRGGTTMILQGDELLLSIDGAQGGKNGSIDVATEYSGLGGKSPSGANGGDGGQAPGWTAASGGDNVINFYMGGNPGDETAGLGGGGGGGAGTKGNGANGGASGLTVAGNGEDAAPNSGGGGGGGGTIVYTAPPGTGGNGGKGSDGYLYIVW